MEQSHRITPPRKGPEAVYYHHGIGGRGNYHKYNKESELRQRPSGLTHSVAAMFGSLNRTSRRTSGSPSLLKDDELKGRKQHKSFSLSRWFKAMGCFGGRRVTCQHPPSSNMSCITLTSENDMPKAPEIETRWTLSDAKSFDDEETRIELLHSEYALYA